MGMLKQGSLIACLLMAAGTASAGVETAGAEGASKDEAIKGDAQRMRSVLSRHVFKSLPAAQQRQIVGAGTLAPAFAGEVSDPFMDVSSYIDRASFEKLSPVHQKMLVDTARGAGMRSPLAVCFDNATVDPAFAQAFSQALFGAGERFQQTNRWSFTALQGGGLTQGTPTTITYGFVPDGTFVPNQGLGSGNSRLFEWMDGIYAGGQAQWQPLYDEVFARWSEISGINYVFEPNDDGSSLNVTGNGQAGVRADARIAAISLDGFGGVLAYNNFPNDGDMVLDAFDGFYSNTGGNSIRLRNIISHEAGHGLGMLHVCPVENDKLMEPFINTNFDGPQVDDLLNAQRHYGDYNEPNDSPIQPTDLGTISGLSRTVDDVSIDDNADRDYYSFTIDSPQQLTVTLSPQGGTYLQGPQTQSCNTGTSTNYTAVHNLSFTVYDQNGIDVLADVDNNGTGGSEFGQVILPVPGTYFVEVNGDNTNSIQLYDLGVTLTDLPFVPLFIQVPGNVPEQLDPGVPETFNVVINQGDDALVDGSAILNFRTDGGSFDSIELVNTGGNNYTATIPATLCEDNPEFFISATGVETGVVNFPTDGASDPFAAGVGEFVEVFADNFQTDLGWTVTGDANDGQWERGVPAGDADRGDPGSDGDGSGAAYLTDNVAGNSDVDGGSTILTSPTLDASGLDPVLSYFRWYSNDAGASPNADVFVVEISNDNGASWTNLETVGPAGPGTGGGWIQVSFNIADVIEPTATMRVRFNASDLGDGSVIEAGVDGVTIDTRDCEDVVDDCIADWNNDGDVDFFDVQDFLAVFSAGDPAADLTNDGTLDFFDVQEFLAQFSAGCP